MRSFVPFKADFKDIVTELQDDPGLAIETKVGNCKITVLLWKRTHYPNRKWHGKTFICREILFDFLKKDRETEGDVSEVIAKLRGDSIGKEGITAEGKNLLFTRISATWGS